MHKINKKLNGMKIDEATLLIHVFAVANGGVAFTLANTALGDTLLVTGLTFYMIQRLAKIYDVEDVGAKQIVSQCAAYYAGPYITGKLLFWFPGVGNWANAATTVLLTETIGWTCVALFSSGRKPQDLSGDEWKSVLRTARAKAEEDQKENKRLLRKMTAEDKRKIKEMTKELKNDNLTEEEKERLLESLKELYHSIKSRP